MSMGIQERIINMMERDETTYEQADDLYRALVRLVAPEEMGKRYKVMAIVPGTSPPPGFDQVDGGGGGVDVTSSSSTAASTPLSS
jgi:SAM-dependent MidA family methyltransferase